MNSPILQKLRRRRLRAFSLTEVAIALATVSVSLVALLGLVSVTLQTGKTSASETSMTTASHQALDVLRSRKFSELLPYIEAADKAATESAAQNEAPTAGTVLPVVYIAEDGQWLAPDRNTWPKESGEVEPPVDAVYKCVVSIAPEETSITPATLAGKGTRFNLARVQLALSPLLARADAKPAVLIHATIPRQ